MDLFNTLSGWQFLLRYLHFLAGITWIGILYYFNFIQTPFFASADAAVRSGMIRGLVPNALWWFRWGAMFTFLSGWIIVITKLSQGIGLADPYMTRILTGGLMGTFMWGNVWFVIWPAQKVVIASAEQVAGGGEALPEAAGLGARAGLASRTNTLLSIPMLFFMGSASHFTPLNPSLAGWWIIAGLIILLVEINGLVSPGHVTQKPLGSVWGTITFGFIMTAVLWLLGALLT